MEIATKATWVTHGLQTSKGKILTLTLFVVHIQIVSL